MVRGGFQRLRCLYWEKPKRAEAGPLSTAGHRSTNRPRRGQTKRWGMLPFVTAWQQTGPMEMPCNFSSVDSPEVSGCPGTTVSIWLTNIDEVLESIGLRRLTALLSKQELSHVNRAVRENFRRQGIASRGILRLLLGEHLGRRPESLVFIPGTYGKPRLADWAVSFNLSHSHGWIMLGVADDADIGVDIQHLDTQINPVSILDFLLTEREIRAWRALPKPQRLHVFFSLWARKEALAKALGYGLALPFNQLDLGISPGNGSIRMNLPCMDCRYENLTHWHIRRVDLPGPLGMEAAVSVNGTKESRVILQQLEPSCFSAGRTRTAPSIHP